jgi:hypothetical protein
MTSKERSRPATSLLLTTVPSVSVCSSWHDSIDRLLLSVSARWLQVIAFVLGCAVVISRRPDAILKPQFWAEDGLIWYVDAYTIGLRSLLRPDVGYLQTLPRVVALAAQPLPLLWAPAAFSIAAIAIQVLPAVILLSRRFMRLSLSGRALMALLYLVLPNSWEVHANLTNAQCHLALLACAVTLAEPSRTLAWRVFDVVVLAFAGLTGPFCLALTPIAVAVWYWRRDRQRLVAVVTLGVGMVVQIMVLISTVLRDRSRMALGANPLLLIRIVSRHVFWGAIEGIKHPWAQFTDERPLLSALVVLTGAAVVLWAAYVGTFELRGFLAFGVTILVAALMSPQVSVSQPQWEVLSFVDGGRYWLFPMLVFVAALVRLLEARKLPLRRAAAVTLLACGVGIIRDWRMPEYQDFDFSRYVRAFKQAPPGTTVTIPINPPGKVMTLVKH